MDIMDKMAIPEPDTVVTSTSENSVVMIDITSFISR
jgi:hypothetical protein